MSLTTGVYDNCFILCQ